MDDSKKNEIETDDKLNSEESTIKNEEVDMPSSETETPEIQPPKKVERILKHPKSDVVHYSDPELDVDLGWAIEFPSEETLIPVWNKLKSFLESNQYAIKGKAKWLTLDPRGYFSPRLRFFISFTGWGLQIVNLPDWFKENISEIKKPMKATEPSEELAAGNWQGYITKETIELTGTEFVKLESFSRNKRKTLEEAKKPISSSYPRYWNQHALYTAKDYLIPVITEEKFNAGEFSSISYLEEYIVEQLEWKENPNNKESFVILPSNFTFDENSPRKIKIPEEYTPEINFDYPGMFPGMGGMPNFGDMGGMGDFNGMDGLDDMPDLDDSELNDSDDEEVDSEPSNTKSIVESDKKDEAIDAEIIKDDS
jgi:hypothetical protein